MFLALCRELEEEHGAGAGDREIADLVDHHRRGEVERAEGNLCAEELRGGRDGLALLQEMA